MIIRNLAILSPATRTSVGWEIVARFDCDLGLATAHDLVLVRAPHGHISVWAKRTPGGRPLLSFTPSTKAAMVDAVLASSQLLASQVAA